MKENIKKIAESMGIKPQPKVDVKGGLNDISWHFTETLDFNPYTSDADCFQVLEALVKKDNKFHVQVWSDGDSDSYSVVNVLGECPVIYPTTYLSEFEKDLKHAICQAYLELIGE